MGFSYFSSTWAGALACTSMMIIFGLQIILTDFEVFLVISNSMPEDKQNGFRNIYDALLFIKHSFLHS